MRQEISIPAKMPMTNELAELVADRAEARRAMQSAYGRYRAASRANDADITNITLRNRYDATRREYFAASRCYDGIEQRVVSAVLAFGEDFAMEVSLSS